MEPMARGTNLVVFMVLASAALAGCSSPKDDPGSTIETSFEDVVATATRGVIKGVVVDQAIRPIADATVELKDQQRAATTTADGLFSFIDLQPGTYFVQASKYGFNSTLTSIEVVAGVDPPILNVPLIANPSERPYLEVIKDEGFIGCSAGGQLDYCGLAGELSGSGEGLFFKSIELTNGVPSWIQTELVWESTQPLGAELKLNMMNETDYTLYYRKNVTSTSPLVGTFNAEEIAQYRFGIDSEYGLLVAAPDTSVVIQQRFTAYTHIFYRFTPPEGWQFSRDGEPPIPPV